jgi:hypothetical protein
VVAHAVDVVDLVGLPTTVDAGRVLGEEPRPEALPVAVIGRGVRRPVSVDVRLSFLFVPSGVLFASPAVLASMEGGARWMEAGA